LTIGGNIPYCTGNWRYQP